MAVKRGPDGNMINEPTKKIRDTTARSPSYSSIDGPTVGPNSQQSQTTGLDGDYDIPTMKRSPKETLKPISILGGGTTITHDPVEDDGLDPATKIYGRQTQDDEKQAQSNAMDDPPVGWIVIITGPGQGNVLKLGYGRNTIGRGETARLKVDFGDGEISRTPHCAVTYDPKSRKFYLTHEEGVNLTYINDAPVLQPTEIHRDARIMIGSTTLRLMPFCDDRFEWQDIAGEQDNT